MRSDQLLARVRLNCTIEDNASDYTDLVILGELNDSGMSTFEDSVVRVRNGYWLDTKDFAVSSRQKFRIPPRACVQGLEKVEISVGPSGAFTPIEEVTEAHASQWTMGGSSVGIPRKFVIRGDQVTLLPFPDATPYTLRMYFYRRPSRLMLQQASTEGGGAGTVRGQITSIASIASRQVTVNAIPLDEEAVSVGGLITPVVITSGAQTVDIIHPDGWHELAAMDLTQTFTGTTITFGGTDDLSEVQVGDFVRVSEQTDWPQLPDDFHRAVADATSVKILAERNFASKAADFATAVSADIARFQNLIQPRTKSGAMTIKAPLPGIRGRPRGYWPGFP